MAGLLENLMLGRSKRAILGKIKPTDLPEWGATEEGIRTTGARNLEDVNAALRKADVTGSAAGTVLERVAQGTKGNILDLYNKWRGVPEDYINQGAAIEEADQARAEHERQLMFQTYLTKRAQDAEEKARKYSMAKSSSTGCLSNECMIMTEGWTIRLELPVRKFRDEHYTDATWVRYGYRMMSRWSLKLLKNKFSRFLTRQLILKPLNRCAVYYYAEFWTGLKGNLWYPFGIFWTCYWSLSARLRFILKGDFADEIGRPVTVLRTPLNLFRKKRYEKPPVWFLRMPPMVLKMLWLHRVWRRVTRKRPVF